MNDPKDSLYKDDWWLEHLEEELEPNLREDLELLLKNSNADRKILEGLKSTRRILKESDDVAMPESGLFYENLHSKIMASLDDEVLEMRASVPAYAGSRRRFAWSKVLAPVGMTMMMALVSWMSLKSGPMNDPSSNLAQQSIDAAEQVFERRLAMVTTNTDRRSISESMLGFESENDFIASAAARKLEKLSPAQVEAIMRMMKN